MSEKPEVIRCAVCGGYYNGSQYAQCPYCANCDGEAGTGSGKKKKWSWVKKAEIQPKTAQDGKNVDSRQENSVITEPKEEKTVSPDEIGHTYGGITQPENETGVDGLSRTVGFDKWFPKNPFGKKGKQQSNEEMPEKDFTDTNPHGNTPVSASSAMSTSSATPTPSVTPTPSAMPTPSVTPTPSAMPTPSVTPTPSASPASSVTPTPSASTTSSTSSAPAPTLTQSIEKLGKTTSKFVSFQDGQTVEPMVGWLIGVKGAYYGQALPLKSGANRVGRSHEMEVALMQDDSISRDIVVKIVYDARGNQFNAIPGDANSLCYVNGEALYERKILKGFEEFEFGDQERNKFVFVPLCGDRFLWSNYPF